MGIGTFTNLGGNFGGTSYDIDVHAYEGFVEPTGNGLMDLLQESAHDFYQLNAALYVADVVHEQATMESAEQADFVLENVVKDTVTKLKEIFVKMWSKVKAWFASVIQRLKLLFQSGEKFINANKKKLEEKNVLGFKYTGFKWDIDAAIDKADGFIIAADKGIQEQNKIITQAAQGRDIITSSGELKPLDEEKEAVFRAMGVDAISEIKKEIALAARSGEETPEEIEDFSANSKNELIDLVKNSSKAIKAVQKNEKQTQKDYNEIIKTLDKAAKEVSKGDADTKTKGAAINHINRASKLVQFLLTIVSAANAAVVDSINDATKAATSTLKKYLTYKPAKESYDGSDLDASLEGASLIDRAMKLV